MSKKKSSIDEVNDARKLLRESGLRSTPARISVINALKRSTKPQTHADLTEAELVLRTELGDHVWRFELRDPSHDRSSHPHFVCTDCGTVSCIDEMALPSPSVRRSLNISRISEVLVKGHCGTCDSARAAST